MEDQQRMRQALEDRLATDTAQMAGRVPTLHRLEDLLLRLLVNSGDSEILAELGHPKQFDPSVRSRTLTEQDSASGHSRFSDVEEEQSQFTDEHGLRAPAPPGSFTSSFRRGDPRHRDIPDSLLISTPRIEDELDEEWELDNLPRGTPDPTSGSHHRAMPPNLSHLLRKPNAQTPIHEDHYQSEDDDQSTVVYNDREEQVPPPQEPRRVPPPIPIPAMQRAPSSSGSSDTITPPRPRLHHPGPLPRPLGVPSPVRLDGHPRMPSGGSFRPMPGPSMLPGSRMGGTRQPMTTT